MFDICQIPFQVFRCSCHIPSLSPNLNKGGISKLLVLKQYFPAEISSCMKTPEEKKWVPWPSKLVISL